MCRSAVSPSSSLPTEDAFPVRVGRSTRILRIPLRFFQVVRPCVGVEALVISRDAHFGLLVKVAGLFDDGELQVRPLDGGQSFTVASSVLARVLPNK